MVHKIIQTVGGINMTQFLIHEQSDDVGVATVDIKAGETAQGLYMDTQEKISLLD